MQYVRVSSPPAENRLFPLLPFRKGAVEEEVKVERRAAGEEEPQRPERGRRVGAMARGQDYRCVRVKRRSQASSICTSAPTGQKLGPDRLLLSTRAFRVPD